MFAKLNPLKVDLDSILYKHSALVLSKVLSHTVIDIDLTLGLKINAYKFW